MPTYPPIHNWTDGLLAIRQRAISTRGVIELDDGPKWPRTTGDDIVLVAALFDPSVRALRATAVAGIVRRWRTALDTIESTALAAPGDTYSDNRNFWATLELAAVMLDDQAAPVPSSDAWHALIHELGTRPRNARDPRVDALAVFVEMGQQLRAKRGAVPASEIAGLALGNAQIPRLTNGDAVQLVAFWGEWLSDTPADPDGDFATEIQARWRDALDDVLAIAKGSDPNERYAKPADLWRVVGAVAAYISQAAEQAKRTRNRDDDRAEPSDDEDSGDPFSVVDREDPLELFIALRAEMSETRGADEHAAPPNSVYAGQYMIPRTTLADVQRIADEWSERAASPLGKADADTARQAREHWRRACRHVERAVKSGDPAAVYEHNNEFWRALTALAITLSAAYEVERKLTRNAPSHAWLDIPWSSLDGLSDGLVPPAPYSWLDHVAQRTDPLAIYTAMVQHFAAERGADVKAPPPGFGGTTRLIPRTTNHDVLTIAAWCSDQLADTPHVPAATGDEITRWTAAMADVNALAWPGDPDATYAHNNEFWRAFAKVVTLMSATDDVRYGRVPTTNAPPRNAAPPPFGPFPGATTYGAIFYAQKELLRQLRGEDLLAAPSGFVGPTVAIPRTTIADALALAQWWLTAFSAHRAEIVDTGDGTNLLNEQSLLDAIDAVLDASVMTTPNAVYAHNNELWRTLGDVAEALTAVARYLTTAAPRNAPPPPPFGPFPGVSKYDEICTAQKQLLRQQRGEDTLAPPPGFQGMTVPIPRTTNADVQQLAAWWDGVWHEAADKLADAKDNAAASTSLPADWSATLAAVAAAKTADPSDVYAHNNEFWRVLGRLAVEIATAIEAPTWTDIAKQEIKDKAEEFAHGASAAVHGVGQAVSAVGGFFLDSIKKPLLLGGVALGGLYLLTRNREER